MKLVYILLLVRLAVGQKAQSPVCATVTGQRNGQQSSLQVPICTEESPGFVDSNLSPVVEKQGCPGVNFNFPSERQVTDYVRYRSYFPVLNEATVCFWVNSTKNNQTFNSLFSYAVTRSHNEILFGFQDSNRLDVHIRDQRYEFNIPLRPSGAQMLHVCGWFSSVRQEMGLYVDAIRRGFLSYQSGPTVGGGSLILAQEQDSTNARSLDPNQSFSGTISHVFVWPRVLDDAEVKGLANKCECPRDYSVVMTMDRVELRGAAGYNIYPECLTL